MLNPYKPKLAKIIKIKKETTDAKLFTLQYINKKDQEDFSFNHGQFMMAGLSGFGEGPFDICSNIFDNSYIDLCIREVGDLTSAFHRAIVGDTVLIRGPYGHGFPMLDKLDKPNLLLIGGGCGFISMKSIIEDYVKNFKKTKKAQVFYGALNEDNLLYKNRYREWQKHLDLQIILNKPTEQWKWKQGLITQLFKDVEVIKDATVIMVGPPVMYKFVLKELKKINIDPSDIYISFERRMHCGIGICHHCAIGSKLVCKDGPVFLYDEIKGIDGAI